MVKSLMAIGLNGSNSVCIPDDKSNREQIISYVSGKRIPIQISIKAIGSPQRSFPINNIVGQNLVGVNGETSI